MINKLPNTNWLYSLVSWLSSNLLFSMTTAGIIPIDRYNEGILNSNLSVQNQGYYIKDD